MPDIIVNTTPLIVLANVGQFDLLRKLYGEIIIPQAVLEEIKSQPAKRLTSSSDWIKIVKVANKDDRGLFRARLHAGEVEVMLLAQERNADLVIMDDNAAKKTAKFMGLKVTGTLGVLLRAKQEEYIQEVKSIINAMMADGFYIDEKTRRYVLDAAKET